MEQIRSLWDRMQEDRTFWVVIGVLILAYFLFALQNALSMTFTLLALVVAITVHECGHAWSANKLGDPTARLAGRITLNPLAHLDPLGALMIVITTMSGIGIGWGKPTPVTPYRLKHGSIRGGALVSAAGPVANLVTAALAALVLRVLLAILPTFDPGLATTILEYVFSLLRAIVGANTVIAFFNLLPIPPLDGHSVLIGLFSLVQREWSWQAIEWLEGLRRYGMALLLGLVIISAFLPFNLIGILIGPPAAMFYALFMGPAA